ncbi:MAG: hypothetical protein ACLUHL_09010 [Dysosmobacter welbionis]
MAALHRRWLSYLGVLHAPAHVGLAERMCPIPGSPPTMTGKSRLRHLCGMPSAYTGA